jgi:hypothetical protein
MWRLRRFGVAAVLASSLALTLTMVTPASAAQSGSPAVGTQIRTFDPCGALSEYIQFLEQRPAGPLRDFLLAQSRHLFARYCS